MYENIEYLNGSHHIGSPKHGNACRCLVRRGESNARNFGVLFESTFTKGVRSANKFRKSASLQICGPSANVALCGFATYSIFWDLRINHENLRICGLAHLINLRICKSGMSPRSCGFAKTFACPPLTFTEVHMLNSDLLYFDQWIYQWILNECHICFLSIMFASGCLF